MPQVAFLFPGQGAQAVGMGRQLCEALPAARQLFDEAAAVLGYDLADVCANGPAERLTSTVVGLEEPAVRDLCARARGQEVLEIANYLCPGNIVLSGSKAACDAVEKLAESAGGRTVRLTVAGAFHTVLMKPADQKLAQALAG